MHEDISTNNKNSLRFGILLNAGGLVRWQVRCLELLIQAGHQPVVAIINNEQAIPKSRLAKLKNYPWSKLFYRFHQRYFFRPPAKNTEEYPGLKNLKKVYCTPSRKGFSEYIDEATLDEIRASKADFLIRFGFNILRGEVLNVCKYGIWSFHHDDEQRYRGGPPGFWEIMKNDRVNAVILQRLTEKLDAGIILQKAYFGSIMHSWEACLDRTLMEAAHLPAKTANAIANGTMNQESIKPATTSAPIYKTPGNFAMIRFMLRIFRNKIIFHFRELFRAEQWNVGVIMASPEQILKNPEAHQPVWMPAPPRKAFYADPFILNQGQDTKVFFEHYFYKTHLGNISQRGFDPAKGFNTSIDNLLIKNYHLAYPFVFNYQSNIYLIPESAENRSIDLYRYHPETSSVTFVQSLLADMDAVDTTLFVYDELFWLCFTRKTLSDTHLYLYFSKDLTGEYKPHLQNPVKSDVRNSRPGGTPFIVDGKLIRPAQDCSRTYGGAVVFNKIIRLNPKDFEEVQIGRLEPFINSPYKRGLHTFAAQGNSVAVDGKQYIFSIRHFMRILGRKIKNLRS